ncbi:MAG: tRNA (N6-threonylcarbamoyladenosine(37)-N6)-methyltransferase TrmO [Aliarcobacter sp.]|nr:tRNA (N6-threonylcarbamoyladenosine(37)-N6)-methyltransferase TrmO [Aliarcobacter sp.]
MQINLESIGTILTEFTQANNMPVQPCGGENSIAKIVIKNEYVEGLKDLDGFSHIYLIYYFHKTKEDKLEVIPFNDKTNSKRGVFSTRTPVHPNKIGLSLVKLESIKDNIIEIRGVDILNETPLLDIKPYIPNFDFVNGEIKSGWMKSSLDEVKEKKSDNRFS